MHVHVHTCAAPICARTCAAPMCTRASAWARHEPTTPASERRLPSDAPPIVAAAVDVAAGVVVTGVGRQRRSPSGSPPCATTLPDRQRSRGRPSRRRCRRESTIPNPAPRRPIGVDDAAAGSVDSPVDPQRDETPPMSRVAGTAERRGRSGLASASASSARGSCAACDQRRRRQRHVGEAALRERILTGRVASRESTVTQGTTMLFGLRMCRVDCPPGAAG